MKIFKLIMLAGIGTLAYHFLKNNQNEDRPDEPGFMGKFVDKVGESISKPIDEVAADASVSN